MDGLRQTLLSPTSFRQFFFRGLAILLPSVLTVWILLAAYQFVQSHIAGPINSGVQTLVVHTTPWPLVTDEELQAAAPEANTPAKLHTAYRKLQREKLTTWWSGYSVVLDLIGLIIAIVLIYMAGLLLGSFIGRRLYHRGEMLVNRVPLIGRVYPSVKQVTDFLFGQDRDKLAFNRVVAVQYPRKGLWSIGLVTGNTMRRIEEAAGEPCLTIFIPSSPTPFTGYVITVPKADTIDLPITIEDAVKFTVSGGVLIPPAQQRAAPETDPLSSDHPRETDRLSPTGASAPTPEATVSLKPKTVKTSPPASETSPRVRLGDPAPGPANGG